MRELFREYVVGQTKKDDERDAAMSLAWQIAALQKRNPLPKLETLLTKRRSAPVQTVDQQRAMLEVLSAQYGLPLGRTGRKGRVRG